MSERFCVEFDFSLFPIFIGVVESKREVCSMEKYSKSVAERSCGINGQYSQNWILPIRIC